MKLKALFIASTFLLFAASGLGATANFAKGEFTKPTGSTPLSAELNGNGIVGVGTEYENFRFYDYSTGSNVSTVSASGQNNYLRSIEGSNDFLGITDGGTAKRINPSDGSTDWTTSLPNYGGAGFLVSSNYALTGGGTSYKIDLSDGSYSAASFNYTTAGGSPPRDNGTHGTVYVDDFNFEVREIDTGNRIYQSKNIYGTAKGSAISPDGDSFYFIEDSVIYRVNLNDNSRVNTTTSYADDNSLQIEANNEGLYIFEVNDGQLAKFNESLGLEYTESVTTDSLDYTKGTWFGGTGFDSYSISDYYEPEPPKVTNIDTIPSDVSRGETAGVEATIETSAGVSSATATIYDDGTLQVQDATLTDGDSDNVFDNSSVFTLDSFGDFTVEINATDNDGLTSIENYTFSISNDQPVAENVSFTPSNIQINDSVDYSVDVSDRHNLAQVSASVYEDGNLIVTNQSLSNTGGNTYGATGLFTADEYVTYEVVTYVEDEYGASNQVSDSKTVAVTKPNPDTLSESPLLENANRLDKLDVNVSGTVGDFPVDRINVKIWDQAATSIYANKTVTDITQGSNRGDSFSIEETDLIDITESIEGKDVLFGATVYDTQGNSAVVGADITDTGAAGTTITVGTYSDPTINNFNVTPSISSASVGDQFDVSVDGDVGEKSIDKVTYRLAVTNAVDPEPITKSPNFQDQNTFTDSVTDAFEFKDAYKGETLTFKVEVNDTLGYESTAQISDTQNPPPDSFIQLQPDQGQVFLIAEGDTNTTVDVEYGVDTSNNGGTVELLVNGNVEDSFSISGNTQETRIKTLTLTEGSYDWKVRFTDGTTGEVYSSSNKVFEVTDEPIALSLNSPTGLVSITNDTTTTIDHDFEVDARAFSGNYFYDFELTNDDTGSVVSDRTSPDNSGGNIDSFTESVAGLDESNYTWSVDVKRSSDGLLLESSNVSYTIEANPKFDGNIKKPSDGERFSIAEDVTNRDVNATYVLDTKASDVDATLYLNGNVVESRTVSSNSYETFDVTLQDLTDGDYTLRLYAEDSGGRTINKTVDFEIVRTAEEQIEFTEIRTTPSLEEATVGDEVDIYFEGTGNISDVDFVEFEITSDGETIKTLTVPREDLQEGSWFGTIDAAFTVTEELLGTDLGILGEANSVEGYTTSYFLSATLGSDRSIVASLDTPPDGKTFGQTDGNVEPIRYDFDVTTVSYPVNWTLQAKEVGGSWQDVKDGNVTKTNSTVDVTAFINHQDTFGKQFGDFAYRVKLVETSSAVLDSPDEFTSPSRTYSIVNESEQPVILNLNKPEKNGVYYADTAADDTDVPFDFDVDTPEQGTLSVVVDGREIYDKQVSDGFTSDRFDERLGVGTYDANITFESSSYFESVENTFSVEQEPDDKSNAFVKLKEPSDGRTLYQNFGNRFAWKVYNPATNNDSVSPEGTTTLFIKNENGDVVETFDREYNTQNEVNVFSNLYDTDLNIGSYTFQANFSSPSLDSTITSEVRSFTVADFKPPTSTLGDPENDTFASNDSVAFDWTTTSYQEAPTVRLQVRNVDDYEATTLFESSQGATETRDYDFNTSDIDVGSYEWFVEMELDGGATFESSAQKFTIEPNQIKPPVYDLKEPEQGTKYDSGSDNKTDVSFVYDVTGFSKTDATVELLVQEVVDGGGEEFEVVDSNLQNDADGTVSYNYTKSLDDGGYRWKVRVEYPNGQTNESDPISFAVGEDSTVPKAEPTEGLIDAVAKFAGDLNSEFKNAVGKMGQYFVATALVIGLSGAVHLAFRVRFLTALTSSLLAVGFSLADGYYPLAMFWIVLALAATLAGMFAVRVSKGDS